MQTLNTIHGLFIDKENYLKLIGNLLIKSIPNIDYEETKTELELATFFLRAGVDFNKVFTPEVTKSEEGDFYISAQASPVKMVKMYSFSNGKSQIHLSLNAVFMEGNSSVIKKVKEPYSLRIL